jgi:hypothetical protein
LASIWREIWERRREDWRAGSNRMLSAGWFTRRSVTINPSDKLWMPPRGTLLRRPSLQASFNLQKGQQHSLSSSLSLSRPFSFHLFSSSYICASFLSTYSLCLILSIPFFSSISRTEREEKHEEEYGGKVKLIINFPRQINKEKKRRGG